MRAEQGLDAPLPAQYARWMFQALAGDMDCSVGPPHRPDSPAHCGCFGSGVAGSRAHGHPVRTATGQRRGCHRALGGAGGRHGAVLRLGLRTDHPVCGEIVLAVGLGLRFSSPSRTSGHRPFPRTHGSTGAADTRQHVGDTGAGLHPYGAGQGTVRTDRRQRARLA